MEGELTKVVPCGYCYQCLHRRQSAWAFRLGQELKRSTSACFLTLTYTDENIPKSYNGNPTLEKKHYQNFTKRLRKKCKTTNIKYYACGEYGDVTNRPHYHAIIFNLPHSYTTNAEHISQIWGQGHIHIAPCTTPTIHYVTKYLMKGRFLPTGELDDRNPHFSLMSKKMGSNYLTPQMIKYHKENLQSYIKLDGGQAASLPRYFRDQIFTNKEKSIINQASKQARELDFEKLFNNDYQTHNTWKHDQVRKQEKLQRLQRAKV